LPILPREVTIDNGDFLSTYTINTNMTDTSIENFMGYPTTKAKAIRSLITAKRGERQSTNNPNWKIYNSPVRKYSEKLLRNESLAQYQYFTDIECSENSDNGCDLVKFWGPDEFWGKVHSNDDIWLQQAGGGNNNGWPLFHDYVTTAKKFKNFNTQNDMSEADLEQVFQGGYHQFEGEGGHIIFNPTADDIRANALWLNVEDKEIIYVTLEGNSFSSMLADIELVSVDTFEVYSWFPADANVAEAVVDIGGNWYEDSDHIWTNYIPIYDTVWAPGPTGQVVDGSVFVNECELWIEGTVGGKQTWGCSDTIFVVGDILYENTTIGEAPDEGDNPNYTDYFGLVSEEKILVRYKHRDPETNEVMSPNCNDVYLYGAYAAIGEGDVGLYGNAACHYDGIFSFQYHHPHGSTPDFIASSPYLTEEYTIRLLDTAGNGWVDASLDILVNGEVVLDGITCYGDLTDYQFVIANGDIIQTDYHAGTNNDENHFQLLNGDLNIVAEDGPPPGPGILHQAIVTTHRDTLYTHVDLQTYIFPPSGFIPPSPSNW